MGRAVIVSLFLVIFLPLNSVLAEDEVNLATRYRVLDACFGTNLIATVKDMDAMSKEATTLMRTLFKAEDLFERVSCLEDRELDALGANDANTPLAPYKSKAASSWLKMKDWDRVRELDACLKTDFAGANARKDKSAADDEIYKMKKALILSPDLSEFISCMEDRDDELFDRDITSKIKDVTGRRKSK